MVLRQVNKRIILYVILLFSFTHLFLLSACGQTKRPSVGLVLSGGGAKGLAHIGVLKVIDELGIPIDYVGGTSMGSVVGGLYAIGYSGKEIEALTLAQDWGTLLTDKLERQVLSVYEKDDYDKYFVSFPFDSLKIILPSGLGAGQNISMFLSKMALPVTGEHNFNNFPRPFLCVATDIVSGKEVVLREGYLPDAIRASMAIPTIFTPVEIGDYYLVDGGLQNNFPVDHVKAMGADIIIGVNLGLKEYSKKELENLTTVLEQSLFFHAKERNKANQKLCDVLLSPDVYASSAASFSDVETLIAVGEDIARKNLEKLLVYADTQSYIEQKANIADVKVVDTLLVSDFEVQGLENVTESFLEGKLRLKIPGSIPVVELEAGLDRAYGTQFFKKVTYQTAPTTGDSVKVILRVDEKSNNLVRVGGRYDSYFKAQILLNVTFRNTLIKGSKLAIDLHLGAYPRFRTEYRINTGWKQPKNNFLRKHNNLGVLPDLGARFEFRDVELNHYEADEFIAPYRYQYFTLGGFISTSISNPFYIEGGVEYDFSVLQSLISSSSDPDENEAVLMYAKAIYDSYDNQVMPHQGALIVAWGDIIKDNNLSVNRLMNYTRAGIRLEKIIEVQEFLHIQPYGRLGIAMGDTIPPLRQMFLGGNMLHVKVAPNIFSFSGMRFLEKKDHCAYLLGAKVRFNVDEIHYFTVDNVVGRLERTPFELFSNLSGHLYGFGLTYGIMSKAGPFELGFYKSNQAIPWQMFINYGYWF